MARYSYPDGRVIAYDYGVEDSISDRLGRIHRIRETNIAGTVLAEYAYNGTSRLVATDYPAPDVKLDLHGDTTGTYAGFDRFGRTVDQRWVKYTSGTVDVDRIKYGYDHASNRIWREDTVAATGGQHHDEFHAYDGLHRLRNFERGNLNGTYTGIVGTPAHEQSWALDQMGNWTSLWDNTGGRPFTRPRQHNEANEITQIAPYGGVDPAVPAHDAAGNMTEMPSPINEEVVYQLKYDAWNRLISTDNSIYTAATYECDGLHRRIVRDPAASPTTGPPVDYYYNDQWQLLTETRDSAVDAIYHWHPF